MFEWESSENFKTQNYSDLTSFLYPNGNISVKRLQLPVPADGLIPFQVELSENVAILTIEVMRDQYDS